MALSYSAKKAYKKAAKQKKKRQRGHWLLIQKGDSVKEICSKLFTQFALLVLIVCIAILANEARLSISTKLLNGSLKDIYYELSGGENHGELTGAAKKLLEINPDTVGWVHIDDTNVDIPVVQRTGEDGNSYYLETAFDSFAIDFYQSVITHFLYAGTGQFTDLAEVAVNAEWLFIFRNIVFYH